MAHFPLGVLQSPAWMSLPGLPAEHPPSLIMACSPKAVRWGGARFITMTLCCPSMMPGSYNAGSSRAAFQEGPQQPAPRMSPLPWGLGRDMVPRTPPSQEQFGLHSRLSFWQVCRGCWGGSQVHFMALITYPQEPRSMNFGISFLYTWLLQDFHTPNSLIPHPIGQVQSTEQALNILNHVSREEDVLST